jgi:PAT family beta-lactamase induction signal transducer AmpG
VFVAGYRVAMLVAGAGALLLADRLGFARVYLIMAGVLALGVLATLAAPPLAAGAAPPASLRAAVVEPWADFFARPLAASLLLLIFLYKLGDAFAGRLTTNFLLAELGFSLSDVGAIYKGLGLVATIGGALYGGALMLRLGLYRALLLFAWLQAVTNLGFLALALTGKSYFSMVLVVGLENLSGGMGTAAFVALLMAACERRYAATQFALLTAVASLGRVIAGPPSGFMVANLGWPAFFLVTTAIALPAIAILRWRRALIDGLAAR